MWKPLSVVSGILLLGAGGIMYTQVRPNYLSEVKQRDAAIANRASALANEKESRKANAQSKVDLIDSQKLLQGNTEKRNLAQQVKDKTVEEREAKAKAQETAQTDLNKLKEELRGLGNLEVVVAELKALEAKSAQLNNEIANTKAATESLITHKGSTEKVISALKIREIYQKTGTVKAGTTSRVTEVNPEYGFIVLAHGNKSNITKNSKWDVVRDNTSVAKLIVTTIEQNRSIAEVIPGTKANGVQILPGDRVVVAASSTPAALAASVTSSARTPAAGAAAPAGAPAVPAADPALTDPFSSGTSAPAVEPIEKPADAPAADAPAADAPKEEMPAKP